jgi:hypothetical protein
MKGGTVDVQREGKSESWWMTVSGPDQRTEGKKKEDNERRVGNEANPNQRCRKGRCPQRIPSEGTTRVGHDPLMDKIKQCSCFPAGSPSRVVD